MPPQTDLHGPCIAARRIDECYALRITMQNKIINAVPDLTFFSTIIGTLLLGKAFPTAQPFPALVYTSVGIILIICGVGFGIATWAYISKHRGSTNVTEIPGQLITSKYFSLSRNPLYFAEFLVVVGVAFLTGSLFAFIGAAFLWPF